MFLAIEKDLNVGLLKLNHQSGRLKAIDPHENNPERNGHKGKRGKTSEKFQHFWIPKKTLNHLFKNKNLSMLAHVLFQLPLDT